MVCFSRLEVVIMEEEKLYLIFEFLSMDLKKFLDGIPPGVMMSCYTVSWHIITNELYII